MDSSLCDIRVYRKYLHNQNGRTNLFGTFVGEGKCLVAKTWGQDCSLHCSMAPLGVPSPTICVVSYVLAGAVYTEVGCVINIDGTTSFAHNSATSAGGKYCPWTFFVVISTKLPADIVRIWMAAVGRLDLCIWTKSPSQRKHVQLHCVATTILVCSCCLCGTGAIRSRYVCVYRSIRNRSKKHEVRSRLWTLPQLMVVRPAIKDQILLSKTEGRCWWRQTWGQAFPTYPPTSTVRYCGLARLLSGKQVWSWYAEIGTGFVRLSWAGSAHIPACCVLRVMKVRPTVITLEEVYSGIPICSYCQQLEETRTRFFRFTCRS